MAEDGEEEDNASKTEEPTYKRLEDAVEKGQVINSREVTSFLALITLTIVVMWVLPMVFKLFIPNLSVILEQAGDVEMSAAQLGIIMKYAIGKAMMYLLPVFILLMAVTIFSHFAQQGRLVFSTEPIMPDLSRLSIIKGIERLFSKKNLVEFLKNIAKLIFVGTFVYLVIASDIQFLRLYGQLSVGSIVETLYDIISHILICVCVTVGAIAGVDYVYQRFEYFRALRMTKQEIKEEHKQSEGNPEIKQKQRQLRRDRAQASIRQSVPTADVIITNPEHFAIALKYDPAEMPAPMVVAKGLDLIALDIRKIAEEHDIPIIENPPLARALYKDVGVDEHVPLEHYEAVAKIISYVFGLRDKKRGN